MTTKTGQTQLKLAGDIDPPSFAVALFGGLAMTAAHLWVWANYSSAHACITDPYTCLRHFGDADPWGRHVLSLCLFALSVWAVSALRGSELGTSDPGLVDQLWSTVPIVHVWGFYLCSDMPNPRLLLMCCLVTLWGARLTYNFAIKGGYSGGEDYRWAQVRQWYPGFRFELFNFVFICFFQLLTILGFSSPAAVAMQNAAVEWSAIDTVATLLFLLFLAIETIADRQQWLFQTEKYRRIRKKLPLEQYEKGFIDTGLWAYSRHPNYFGEVSIWWAFYLFSVAASGNWLNYSLTGPVATSLLFLPPRASVDVTESLSMRKYPAFKEYQQRVSRFVPWFPSASRTPATKDE